MRSYKVFYVLFCVDASVFCSVNKMSKLSFRARALDASKPMPIYLAEELPDLPDYSAINRAVPQMPSGMEKEEESEHHLQRAISGTGLIIPTPEVCQVIDLEFYERCYPPDYKIPKQHIHMQPLWEEQEAPEYDIDSEDERWLKQQRHPELTELKFEQMMDKLEKSSGQTVVTLNEAKLLLERHDDLVIAVYDYWLNKRLNTQHALILSVKTENRPGQSSNNPYLAFRRRTEKMQTRKNRKNDESSYEKMLKLRRDLARALTLLELVAQRECAKRDLVRLTAMLADRRYQAGDFAHQLLPDPPPRPQYTAVPLTTSNYRREAYTIPHYPPRPPATPVDQPRQREKRSYKRRKHRHPVAAAPQGPRDSGVYTSSEEEGSPRAEPASPPDDGPFAFRRKPGCYYEMPTTTLCGDPVDPDSPSKEGLFQHEIDERHRYTLASLSEPYPHCVGFVRRRACRGGRVALDRRRTPLDPLWRALPFDFPDSARYRRERDEEVELETKAHRTPKEMTRDYHSGGKYPWRHAFRQHLARHPELWTVDVKPDVSDVKIDAEDVKLGIDDVKVDIDDVKIDVEDVDDVKVDVDKISGVEKLSVDDIKMDIDECKIDSALPDSDKSDISINARTMDSAVRRNLVTVMRKRSWSGCTDSSYDSDESLYPVEKEFEKFINEVNTEWLHFRAASPPPPPPPPPSPSPPPAQQLPVGRHTPLAVELRPAETPPSGSLDCFTTTHFTLADLYPDVAPQVDLTGSTTGNSTELVEGASGVDSFVANLGNSDRKVSGDIHDELVNYVQQVKDPFLLQGQRWAAAGAGGRGSSAVSVRSPRPDRIYLDKPQVVEKRPVKVPVVKEVKEVKEVKKEVKPEPAPVPTQNIIVEEVNELVPQINVERKRKEDTIEEVTLPHGVQLKTVHTKHSPLKKHIITSATHRRPSDVTLVTSAITSAATSHDNPTSQGQSQPQIVTVAVSESLKMRLQSQLAHGSGSVVVSNGPFPGVVALPVHSLHHNHASDTLTVGTAGVASVASVAGVAGARRAAPLVQLAGARRGPGGAAHLKVVHAAPLQRAALMARGLQLAPTVVSLAALDKAAPGSVAQLIEIKPGQLAKGAHLLNVVRQPQPHAARPRAPPEPLAVSVAGRAVVRAPPLRHQLQLRTRGPPLLHKGHPLAANVQAIAFTAAQLRAARLGQPPAARPAAAAPAPAAPPAPAERRLPAAADARETHVT